MLQEFSNVYDELYNMTDALYRTAENSIASA
jgi:hypothetical protein